MSWPGSGWGRREEGNGPRLGSSLEPGQFKWGRSSRRGTCCPSVIGRLRITTSGRTGVSFLVNSCGISQLGAVSPFFYFLKLQGPRSNC